MQRGKSGGEEKPSERNLGDVAAPIREIGTGGEGGRKHCRRFECGQLECGKNEPNIS